MLATYENDTAKTVASCLASNIIYSSNSASCEDDTYGNPSSVSLLGPLTWILVVYILVSVAGLGTLIAAGWLDFRLNVNTRLIDALIRSRIENEYVHYVRRYNLFPGSIRPPSVSYEVMRADTVARWMARERYIQMTGFDDLDTAYIRERRAVVQRGPSNYPQRTSSMRPIVVA